MGGMRLGMKKTFTRTVLVVAPLGVIAASFTGVFAAAAPQQPARSSQAAPSPAPTAARPQAPARTVDPQGQVATLKQYCATCHSDRVKTAGVSFEGVTVDNVTQHPDVMEKAVRKMRGRVMPPPGAKQPDAASLDALVGWLETSLDKAESRDRLRDRVVLHRLNRKEYSNVVR